MKRILTALMIMLAIPATASTNYVFTGATNEISPAFLSKCLIYSSITNSTLEGGAWDEDSATLTVTYTEPLSAADYAIVSNTANFFATNSSSALAVDKWKDLKTNFTAILAWESRLTNRLASVNGLLMLEGIITNNFTPQNSTPAIVGAAVAQSTNALIGQLGLALDADVKYLYLTTEGTIGRPPDGSEILYHVPVNE